jgi:hypothetical protein
MGVAFSSGPVGLALSGGSVRGIAHIGVMKAMTERGITPTLWWAPVPHRRWDELAGA